MGCCIGKLRRKGSDEQVGCDGFHQKPVDKVVITQAPPPPMTVTYSKSVSSLKDRTFSNEFLISCLKDNPQVATQLNHIRPSSPTPHSLLASRAHPKIFDYRAKSADQPAPNRSSLGHRTRHRLEWQQTSPSAVRRKYPLTRDQELPNYYGQSSKAALLRSPSPSRRFYNTITAGDYKHSKVKRDGFGSRSGSGQQGSPSVVYSKKHHHEFSALKFHADSPGANQQVSSSALIGEMECMVLEDLDNPLISLDCFIFL